MRRDFVFRLLFTIEMRVLSLIVCFGLASLAVVEAAPDKISQYEDGTYELVFPMVVGLRYIPQPLSPPSLLVLASTPSPEQINRGLPG